MAVRYGFRLPGEGDDFEGLDPEALLRLLLDDLMDEGDLEAAIDRLLREGFETEDGERVDGLYDLLEQARQRRYELEQAADPGDTLARFKERLDEIVATEKAAMDELAADAQASGDERRIEVTEEYLAERRLSFALLPEDTGDRITAMQHHEFVSSEAREAFEALVDELRSDILDTYFEANKAFFENPDQEELARVADMMNALSTMMEQERRGEPLDPTFDEFMEQFGDFFPDAQSLDDVVRAMAERAAAAEAMFNALSFEQQQELRNLFNQFFEGMGLNDALNRLIANLRQAAPDLNWQRAARLRGDQGSFGQAASAAAAAARLARLEEMLAQGGARALREVDIDAIRRDLGDDAARHIEKLQRAVNSLSDSGLVNRRQGRLELSAKGLRAVGSQALKELFAQLHGTSMGAHHIASVARGHDREETSKPWEPGQPVNLHLAATLRNAVFRQGPGTPVRLLPEDFEVEEHEAQVRAATVIAVDLSLSMKMRDNLGAAKKMVLALSTLIRTQFPRDYVAVIGFGHIAQEVRLEDVPYLDIDYQYGTNLQHALALSRHLMRNERGTKQVVVVTDGEPTAHIMSNGEPFFSYPPVPETLHATMAEVLRCTKAGMVINTFALDIERTHFPFVEQIARVNKGRTFYTDVHNLGAYVVDDFVRFRTSL